MTPERIQRRRTKGWRMPPNTVYVGRPSKWGNPYPVGEELESVPFVDADYPARHFRTAEEAVECYREALPYRRDLDVSELRGKNLACWCPSDRPCHADVLLELANISPNCDTETGDG